MAAAMQIVGAVGGMGQGFMNMYAQREQGKFQKRMLSYQADLERHRASLAQQNAEIQAGRLAEQRRIQTAEGTAAFAANGLLLDGSPADAPNVWEQDMAAESAWQQEELRTQAMYEVWGHATNAKMLTLQGRMARRAASVAMWGSGIGILSGSASSASSMMGSFGGGNAQTTPVTTTTANYAGKAGTHEGSSLLAYA